MYAGAIALLAIVFTVPSDFASMEGFTLDARGQILVSGDTSSNKEMLTAIGVLQSGPSPSTDRARAKASFARRF